MSQHLQNHIDVTYRRHHPLIMKFKYSIENYIRSSRQDNVKILDINLNRNNFTQHGLHLNTVSKGRVAEMIVKNIKQLMGKTKNIPIILDWEGNPKNEWPKSP
jgi:Cu/Ag efflux pump CusA